MTDYLKIAEECGGVCKSEYDIVMSAPNLARFAERVRGVPEWHPIATAPKDGTHIWAFADGEQIAMHWIDIVGGCWVYSDSLLSDVCPDAPQPDHWMPLPDAPGASPCPPAVSDQSAEIERLKKSVQFLRSERPMARRLTELEQERDRLREALVLAKRELESCKHNAQKGHVCFDGDDFHAAMLAVKAAIAATTKAEPHGEGGAS